MNKLAERHSPWDVCLYSDIDEDVRSLKQFSTDLVFEATARCLHTIDSSLDVQYRLPPSMAAQFRIGTALATAVQVRSYC